MAKIAAKIATKNRHNRQMAESYLARQMKVVESQILRGKLVSQASFGSLTPELDRFKT